MAATVLGLVGGQAVALAFVAAALLVTGSLLPCVAVHAFNNALVLGNLARLELAGPARADRGRRARGRPPASVRARARAIAVPTSPGGIDELHRRPRLAQHDERAGEPSHLAGGRDQPALGSGRGRARARHHRRDRRAVHPVIAIVFGRQARRDVGRGAKSGRAQAQGGFILGIVAVVGSIISWIVAAAIIAN